MGIKNQQIVPLNIFQTWWTKDLPVKMKETVELLKSDNPEFNHYLYDDDMMYTFIKDNFDNDVLYTFEKIIPGAFKADLWRYCILYIHGGIYLDIKFRCVNGFKLIQLTDQEYYVRDRDIILGVGEHGIYQALLVCFPFNKILLKCIHQIVENVKNNSYENLYDVTGPLLMSMYFRQIDIKKFILNFDKDGKDINFYENHILKEYPEYRSEQSSNSKTKYYSTLFDEKDVYNYKCLNAMNKFNFTNSIDKLINGERITFYSGTPCITPHPTQLNRYLVNIRWTNYNGITSNGAKENIPSKIISLTSKFEVDKNIRKTSDEIFLTYDFEKEKYFQFIGLEDVRLFVFKDKLYYCGTCFDETRKVPSFSCDEFDLDSNYYKRNIIYPNFYNLDSIIATEKNWSLFESRGELYIVYKWFPLQLGKIDFEKKVLNIIDYRYNLPDFFKNSRGTTMGFTFNGEIWFVLHKAQDYTKKDVYHANYQHFLAIFDIDMNLIRYSELFKFDNCKIEFCIGIVVEKERILLSYSCMDKETIIGVYTHECIDDMKWYVNENQTKQVLKYDVKNYTDENYTDENYTNQNLKNKNYNNQNTEIKKNAILFKILTLSTSQSHVKAKKNFFQMNTINSTNKNQVKSNRKFYI